MRRACENGPSARGALYGDAFYPKKYSVRPTTTPTNDNKRATEKPKKLNVCVFDGTKYS